MKTEVRRFESCDSVFAILPISRSPFQAKYFSLYTVNKKYYVINMSKANTNVSCKCVKELY